MSVFMVTWNLNKENKEIKETKEIKDGKDKQKNEDSGGYNKARADFIKHLESYEHIKDGDLDAVYFVSSTDGADVVADFLRKKLDANDCLLVSRMRRGEHQGWLSGAVWTWVNARI